MTARAPFHKIVGKTYPVVGKLVVRRTHANEHYAVDGTCYPTPRREERLRITIDTPSRWRTSRIPITRRQLAFMADL